MRNGNTMKIKRKNARIKVRESGGISKNRIQEERKLERRREETKGKNRRIEKK